MQNGAPDTGLVELFKFISPPVMDTPLGFTRHVDIFDSPIEWDSRDGKIELLGRYNLVDTLKPVRFASLLADMTDIKINGAEYPPITASATYMHGTGVLHLLSFGQDSGTHDLDIFIDDGSTFRTSNHAIVSGHENPTALPQFVVDVVLSWARSEYDRSELELDKSERGIG